MKENSSAVDQERVHMENGTFVVRVDYCENYTWQGEVHWVDKGEKKRFRSALELLQLIESALDTDADLNVCG